MNTIELMLEALKTAKARITRLSCLLQAVGDPCTYLDAAIAAGEAELRREPSYRFKERDVDGALHESLMWTREEIK